MRLQLSLLAIVVWSYAILAQPVADFSVIASASNCNPAIYSFVNASTGNQLNYEWNFGVYPGVNSVFENPSTTYLNCGTFMVKLKVTDISGLKDSTVRTVQVRCSPKADFSIESISGCLPASSNFTSTSIAGSGSITEYIWDFGDGSSGTGEQPLHVYDVPGCKNVTLLVTNSYGCSSDTTINNFVCIYEPPVAAFASTKQVSCSGEVSASYEGISSGGTPSYSYQWIFENGIPSTSTLPNPSITYHTTDSFITTLIIKDTHGCSDTATGHDYVVVDSNYADFAIGSGTRCAPANISFNAFASGNPISWSWTVSQTASISNNEAKNTFIDFPNAGSYDVCLTAFYPGGCTAQKCTTLTMNSSPIANFGAGGRLNTCIVPNEITFSDSSSGSNLSYNWSFPGGVPASSNSQTPPGISYGACGTYSAGLTVSDASGCSSSISKADFLHIYCPQASYSVTPGNGCLPLTASFNSEGSTDNPVSWLWDFDDPLSGAANTSTLQNPSHIFYNAGCYTVKLTTTNAEGCTSHYELQAAVCAGWRPHANFSANPPMGCSNQPIYFSDSSTGTYSYTNYVWGFRDDDHIINSSYEQNPNFTFWDAGTFDILLIVSNYGCADTVTKDDYVHTVGPVSSPKVLPDCGNPLSAVLDGSESPQAAVYEWIILGGTPGIATSAIVTAAFPAPGDYNASLYVEDASGCSDLQNTVVHISDAGTDFTASPARGCKPLQSCFSSTASNAISYEWRVINPAGNIDTIIATGSPCFTFQEEGSYSVQLIVTDGWRCVDTIYKPGYITVSDPKVNFTGNLSGGCAPLEVSFFDSSTFSESNIIAWNWSFGDAASGSGNASTLQNPVHVFNEGGVYPVVLSITDSNGCIRDTMQYVDVNKPDADFSMSATTICGGTETCFTLSAPDNNVSYHWNFGDGATSDSAYTCHLYSDTGVFNILLIATDSIGCSDTISTTQSNQSLFPHPQFIADTTSTTCPPLAVTFTNLSTNVDSLTSWRWDFGDGQVSLLQHPFHIYSQAGKFTVTLIATHASGCSDTLAIPEYINISGPTAYIATAPTSGCVPHQTCMSAVSASATLFTWNLGDGMVLNGTDSICYSYTRTGSFYPELILGDGSACIFSLPMGKVDVVGTVAKFTADALSRCTSGTISFTDSSYGTSTASSWHWEFGDSLSAQNISTQQHPSHFFASPGSYLVTETVTSANGCVDTATAVVNIFSAPQASFELSMNSVCGPPAEFLIANNSIGAGNYSWSFGDNSFSSDVAPIASYDSAGQFIILLTAINEHGCTDTISKNVTVHPYPEIQDMKIAPAEGCVPLTVSFNVDASEAHNFYWNFGIHSTPVNASSPTIEYTYADTGTYSISLLISSVNNCVDTFHLSDSIKVHGLPMADFEVFMDSTAYPYDGTVLFTNRSEGAAEYYWDFGDGISSSETNPSHRYEQIDYYSALLEATTDYGCSDTAAKSFHVIKKALYVPNALHPNNSDGDELVKVWKPLGIGLRSYKAQVFDQWGKLLWESRTLNDTQPAEAWDGAYLGKPCPQDVYVWKIDAVFLDGTTWQGMSYGSDAGGGTKTIGSITLVR